MPDYIFQIAFLVIGSLFLILSKSKKTHQKLVENNGEDFAAGIQKKLRICGYILLTLSIVWLVRDFGFA